MASLMHGNTGAGAAATDRLARADGRRMAHAVTLDVIRACAGFVIKLTCTRGDTRDFVRCAACVTITITHVFAGAEAVAYTDLAAARHRGVDHVAGAYLASDNPF